MVLKVAEAYERYFSRKARAFLCVSEEMRKDLQESWGIEATVLYDRPVSTIKVCSNKDAFLQKYNQAPVKENELLLVSSTSWTKD